MRNKFLPSTDTKKVREYELYEMANGIQVVHKLMPHTKIVHCGFMFDIGTRDEDTSNAGIVHFWEHIAFKGTTKRKAFHIINRLESVGGELNAYTTKDKICFYASVMEQHYEMAVELLTDIAFHSTFPEKEIEKERGVILEEMAMYTDLPEDAICDEFENIVFKNHPLGLNILGNADSVKSISKKDFQDFITKHLDTSKIVFSSVGNIAASKVKVLAEKYFLDIPQKTSSYKRKTFKNYTPKREEIEKPFSQSHAVMGRDAYHIFHKNRLKLFMLTNMLGGPGMNSRLNLALREKRGLVYNVEASYNSYIDAGLIEIYYGAEKKHVHRIHDLVFAELKKLREIPLGIMQLSAYKSQLIGQLAMAEESNVSLMQMMAKSILDMKTIESLEDIFMKISNITSLDLQEVAQEIFVADEFSILTYLSE